MKIAYIATYPPRRCGIGTFTENLLSSMQISKKADIEAKVIAMNNVDLFSYPEEVVLSIQENNADEYLKAADFINNNGFDLCILEHEYGIFGGQMGIYILPLLHKLDIPIITTLHTIKKKPNYLEREVLKSICKESSKVVVMSQKAVKFLTKIYAIPKRKIQIIEHGVPDIKYEPSEVRKELNLEDRKVILTFGFVGKNKGIEIAIKALPEVVKEFPETIYYIVGKTHPNVLKHVGEEYREYLENLVKKLNLDKHVVFINEFFDESELFKYLFASDVYITPYLNKSQITSGTLAYALGSGLAVISTPYWHAEELLADGRGILFDFYNYQELSAILLRLFKNPEELEEHRKLARQYGKKILWPKIGDEYVSLCKRLLIEKKITIFSSSKINKAYELPEFTLSHIIRLTDRTGIIQHARFDVPYLKDGYCLDDNSRALLLVLMSYKCFEHPHAIELATIYLSFIAYMQNEDGSFRNFLSYDRKYLDENGSDDSFGRTIWALGFLLSNPPKETLMQFANSLFFKAVDHFDTIKSIRSIATIIIGLCYYLKKNLYDDAMIVKLKLLSQKLIKAYKDNSDGDWNWFENILAYDNAILPLSLLHTYEIIKDDSIKEVAYSSMDFLIKQTFKNDFLSIVGNEKWFIKNEERSVFAQQPIDVLSTVLMFKQAFEASRDVKYFEKLQKSFNWFLGDNELRINLYDTESGGCCDGLEHIGINRNQGAESTIAYLTSNLVIHHTLKNLTGE